MKVIEVIFTDEKLSDFELQDCTKKRYSFKTDEDLEVGDILTSETYNSYLQVTKVTDLALLKTIELRDDNTAVIIARRL